MFKIGDIVRIKNGAVPYKNDRYTVADNNPSFDGFIVRIVDNQNGLFTLEGDEFDGLLWPESELSGTQSMFDREAILDFLNTGGHIDCHRDRKLARQIINALRAAGFKCGFEDSSYYNHFLKSLRYVFRSGHIHMEDYDHDMPVIDAADFFTEYLVEDNTSVPEDLTSLYDWLPSVV